jgi:beta-galactosidase/beta-glucuronidase
MNSGKQNMTKLFIAPILLLFLSFQLLQSRSFANSNDVRRRIIINREWKFKAGDYAGAESVFYNDDDWTNIHIPHNFSIPYFQTAQWYTGYGWYRKYFDVPAEWNGKRISVEFEGAFRDAGVFVNGKAVGRHPGGYTGFSIDITDAVKTGKNILAVRLNNKWNARLSPRDGDYNFT